MKQDTIKTFVNRLAKIGVRVTLAANYPWIYLDTVNGKKVKGTYAAEHGFTAFLMNVKGEIIVLDTKVLFNKIKETL